MAIFRSRRFSIRSRFFPSIASYPTSRTDGTNRQKSKDAPFLHREIFSDILWEALVRNHVSWRKKVKEKIQSKISLLRNESSARLRVTGAKQRETDKDLEETSKKRFEDAVNCIIERRLDVLWYFSAVRVPYYTITRSRFSPVATHRRIAFFSNNELKDKKKKKNLLWSVHGAMIIIIIIIIEITMLRYMIKMII